MKTKILITLIILIGLGLGGFFVYKNIFVPEKEKEGAAQPILEIPELALKSRFGYMAHHGDWQILEEERERYSYLSWERGHPGFANWQEIEPREGDYHWEQIDRYVETAQEKNIQILFTVWPFTDWDQERCNLHHEWQPNDWGKDPRDFLSLAHRKGKPCDMEAYQKFLRLLVERYDGDGQGDMPGLRYPVRYWEIGNEPDGAHDPKVGGLFFQGSVEDFFEILRVSYTTIKETDPDAKVLITALPSLGDKGPWVRPDFNPEELFELGAADYFDIMNVHSFGRATRVKDLLSKYNIGNKPIWMTEPAGITEYPKIAEMENMTPAAMFKREFEREFQEGVEKIFLGGPESIDQALYEAVLTIETPEEKEEEKKEEIIPKEEGPREISNTTRAGKLERDEIWKGEIYIIGDIIVEEKVTLTIEPGTKVLIAANQDVENLFDWPFDMQQGIRQEVPGEDPYYQGVHFGEPFRDEGNHISIRIHGTLHAVGTPEQMITITSDSPTPGIYDWNHFQFDHGIFSYCIMEYYRNFDPGNGTVLSHNILRHTGECAVCANSSVVVENNMIYDAGHELVDMHNASPTIRNNTIGPNKNRCGIVIDGGSPLITSNTIQDCGSGLLLLVPPEDPNLKDNILGNNTFLNNGENVSYGY